MVAFQGDVSGRERITRQPLQHPTRVRTAINIIAKRHRQAIGLAMARDVVPDLSDHLVKEIRTPVDIPDNVQPLTLD